MAENKQRLSLREGQAILNGEVVADSIRLRCTVTPDVNTSRALGERTQSSRWLGYAIDGEWTQYKATPWLRKAVKSYLETGITPEFTIQGILEDKGSDFYRAHGAETVTITGVVLTGGLNLLELDAEGQVVQETVAFNAHGIVL